MRKSRGDLQEHFYAVGVQVEDCLKCGAHQHHDHRHGNLGDQTLAHENDGKGAEAQNCGERVKGRKLPDNVPQQRKELAGPGAAAKELGNLHKNDRKPHTGNKAAHDGSGDIFDDPPGFQQKEDQKPQRRQQGD